MSTAGRNLSVREGQAFDYMGEGLVDSGYVKTTAIPTADSCGRYYVTWVITPKGRAYLKRYEL